jgi:hypothetical protein
VKRLFGRTDIEDSLRKLDKLENDEARMATVQVLKVTDNIDNKMDQVVDGTQHVFWLLVSIANLNDDPHSNATDGERSR